MSKKSNRVFNSLKEKCDSDKNCERKELRKDKRIKENKDE